MDLYKKKYSTPKNVLFVKMDDYRGVFSSENDEENLIEVKGLSALIVELIIEESLSPSESITAIQNKTTLTKQDLSQFDQIFNYLITEKVLEVAEKASSSSKSIEHLLVSKNEQNIRNESIGTVAKVSIAIAVGAVSDVAFSVASSTSGCFSSSVC